MATERRVFREPQRSAIAERDLDPAMALTARSVLNVNTVVRRLRYETPAASRPVYAFSKRVVDIVIASLALAALLPVALVVAVLIKLNSKGPVFFCQERLGKNMQRFSMIKFRSMRTDRHLTAEELAARNEATGPLFKIRNDPRITTIGRFLRKTSLDELPQIINVLKGEMSIVGPRPPLPRELAGFETVQRQRLQVKPGLAGLWQVSGRSFLTFEEMVALDLEYIAKSGFFYDIALILRTVPAVLMGRGAY